MSSETPLPINNIVPPSLQTDKLPEISESKESVKSEPIEDKKLESTRFNHLAKKESQLVKERELLKKEREDFKIEKERVAGISKRAQEFEDLKTKDKIAAMKYAGFTEEDIINFLAEPETVSNPEEKALKVVQTEINKFKEEEKLKDEQLKQDQQKIRDEEDNKILIKFKSDITSHVLSDKDQYEYCNYYGDIAQELIYETISNTLLEDKVVISIKEASELVESYYEEQDKSMNTLKKRSNKMSLESKKEEIKESNPVKTEATKIFPKEYVNNKVPVKTITNRSVPSLPINPERLSPEQNRQRVIEKYSQLIKKE